MTHWGMYCAQCGVWMRESSGPLVFYPAPEIANADINALHAEFPRVPIHHYRVQEFGKEERQRAEGIDPSLLCPFAAVKMDMRKT